MSAHDSRPDGSDDGYAALDSSAHSKRGNAFDDRHSHRKHNSHGSDNERLRTKDHWQHREKDAVHHDRDYRDKSMRYDRRRVERDGRQRIREHGRRHDYDRDWRQRHRSRSHSKDRSRNQSQSCSQPHSPCKNKRTSGFDIEPPSAAVLPNAAFSGQQPAGVPNAIPGMFQNMLPFGTTQMGALPLMAVQTMTQQATRHARRVYIGGLPPVVNEQTIATFFSHIMIAIGGNSAGPGDAVVNVYINHEKKFAFVEMRTVEEASNAMALDGIVFEGVSVRVRRPTDYNPALAAALGPSQPSPDLNLAAVGLKPGAISGADGPDRIFVGGLPYNLTEAQIRELLESFGPLRGFDLVKDRDTGNSKGYGFCIYQDPMVTDEACKNLDGLKMGDKTLTVRRATPSGLTKSERENILAQAQQHIGMQKIAMQPGGVNLHGVGIASTATLDMPTKILCLTEVITSDQLRDDVEYEEILEDMKEEGAKFGALVDVIIPRPNPNREQNAGVGKAFTQHCRVASYWIMPSLLVVAC
ncbi:splicing factor U2af large subunit A-like isoform X2 [Malania oleifera]|uniref:splicing factor U2af large subunit A-like isoform X2 n=1 Tax=Malania oleifera TaxID=397392 RepID=UPI0025ADFB53|nr:splicing factor U2af large subunit A-like isoform X2 [Malania oleifera]